MFYTFDKTPNRRNSLMRNKWTWYPKDVLPLWVADMDFPAPPPILNAIRKSVNQGVLGYELPSQALKETVAARMDRLYHWKVAPESVVVVPGLASGFNVAARAFCTPRKGLLIQTPVYNEFHEIKNNIGISQYNAPLVQTAAGNILHYEIDWELFRRGIKKAGVFLLCNPHNPLGIVFSRKDLLRMAEICIENNVLIVSDEIHSELLLGRQKFTPLAKLSTEIARRTITLVSPSKTFNVPGLFCGFAIIPDDGLREKYATVTEHLRLHTASLGLTAAQAAFSGECDSWLKSLRRYLTANRDFLIEFTARHLPDVRITRPDATYLAWMDCTALVKSGRIQGSPFDFFMREAKVALSDGKIFGQEGDGFIRLNFGCSRRTLQKALEQMERSLYRRKNG